MRFNYRIGRFIKSYLPNLAWHDDYCYMQAQGYWILANWRLFARTGSEMYRAVAISCSEHVLQRQRPDGAWDYPNREWKGRIATTEGAWASMGLIETYRETGDTAFREGALRWYDFMLNVIGFQRSGEELAANYFAFRKSNKVPNNSAFVLRFLAELAAATGKTTYLQPTSGLLEFLRNTQTQSGEFPYSLGVGRARTHFQCYQYNAFVCLDLIRYHELTGDYAPLPLIRKVLSFLRSGVADDGHILYQCGNSHRVVVYHAAALSAAFGRACQLGIGGHDDIYQRTLSYVLSTQHRLGGFPHSQREYGLLRDSRSYPRYQAMILYHLLQP